MLFSEAVTGEFGVEDGVEVLFWKTMVVVNKMVLVTTLDAVEVALDGDGKPVVPPLGRVKLEDHVPAVPVLL